MVMTMRGAKEEVSDIVLERWSPCLDEVGVDGWVDDSGLKNGKLLFISHGHDPSITLSGL